MKIYFSKVILHNFFSYHHAEIDLKDKGYCLVTGINNCEKDNALNNGSGKSSWGSAICWALTGETINGISQNVKNIFIDEDLCYVKLFFSVDNNSYEVTRYKAPKSDLKVLVNGEDKSGKGIRESEAILNEYFPDLTTNLIASIIILGQGLPGKFSNNTPSGRKEVLEKLSKSDFMINDIKERISNRLDFLNNEKRKFEDNLLSINSKKTLLENQLKDAEIKLENLNKPQTFDSDIAQLTEEITKLEQTNKIVTENLLRHQTRRDVLNESLVSTLKQKDDELKEENDDFFGMQKEYLQKKSEKESEIKTLQNELNRLKSITDICPTCGQKLKGVEKPNTTNQENTLATLTENLTSFNAKYQGFQQQHLKTQQEIDNKYSSELSKIKNEISEITSSLNNEQAAGKLNEQILLNKKQQLNKVELDKQNYSDKVKEVSESIVSLKNSIKLLENDFLYNNDEKEKTESHLSVVNQMLTLTKRDFRGFLLMNIIAFIDKKAKEYSKDIFNTEELDFKLNGNNIDISYCGKLFENLSGGEKQKVDLIIQFAIREMMSKHLNFSSNILVLDEITDNLDALGCSNVLNLISSKLNDIESIFIISHHASELQIPSDTELCIVKGKDGISYIK